MDWWTGELVDRWTGGQVDWWTAVRGVMCGMSGRGVWGDARVYVRGDVSGKNCCVQKAINNITKI